MPPGLRKSSLSQEQIRKDTTGELVAAFLSDLEQANRSVQTRRAYRTELLRLASFHPGSVKAVTTDTLRAFLATRAHLSPASRARTQSALASFFAWAYRHEWIEATLMGRLERVRVDPPKPRWLPRGQIDEILAVIPAHRRRDRVLFLLISQCGLRTGEALGLHVEDLDLTPDDEHISVLGKGGRRRTVLLDDARLVALLRVYLKQVGYRSGPLFRAEKNFIGGPLRYQSAHARWAQYRTKAGVRCCLHQLRHSHATELVNDGVSLDTVRKRLGHKNLQTTLRYADKSDASSDAEIRGWRRRHEQTSRRSPALASPPEQPKSAPVVNPSGGPQAAAPAPAAQAKAVTEKAKKTIRVNIGLNVQENSKFTRGRKRAIEDIERYCLNPYEWRRLDKHRTEYEVTIPYDDDAELDGKINRLMEEISNAAEDRNCFVEGDVQDLDSDRTW